MNTALPSWQDKLPDAFAEAILSCIVEHTENNAYLRAKEIGSVVGM
jgi:hypothetical protein